MTDLNQLQKDMLRTAHLDEPHNRALSLCALGLAGETGEVADLFKKYFYHGKPFDRAKVLEESGDVAWYMAYLCYTLNIEFKDLEKVFLFAGYELPSLESDSNEAGIFTRIGMNLTYRAATIGHYLEDLVFGFQADYPETRGLIYHELGLLWHWLTVLTDGLDSSIIEICQLNIAKLEKRYPNGFNTADSLARRDEQAINQAD